MTISETLEEVRAYLAELKKKNQFRRARQERQSAVELQATLAQCRGKLEICRKDLDRTINLQSKNITQGMIMGTDTVIQEQLLWDAAIGYMLVRDAIYAVETVNSYDSISHAYEMLDTAMKQISGKKGGFLDRFKLGSSKERNAYGYLTSTAALKEKEDLLESFFEKLKREGQIEKRLSEAKSSAVRQSERRYSYTQDADAGMSELDIRKAQLDRLPQEQTFGEPFEARMDDLMDIHPPKDQAE